jgi:uncharacterized membrane protein
MRDRGSMTQQVPPPPPPPSAARDQGNLVNVVYILYLVAVIFGPTAIIGVVMAYVNKGDAPGWIATHYRFQIRTFWIGLLIGVVGMILTIVLIGWLVLLAWAVWLIVRSVKGMKYLSDGRPIPDPETWMIP